MMATDFLLTKYNRSPIFSIQLSMGMTKNFYYGIGYTIYKHRPQKLNNFREGYEFRLGWY